MRQGNTERAEKGLFSQLIAISFNIAIMEWMPLIVLFISFNDKEIAFHSASFGIQNSLTFLVFHFQFGNSSLHGSAFLLPQLPHTHTMNEII